MHGGRADQQFLPLVLAKAGTQRKKSCIPAFAGMSGEILRTLELQLGEPRVKAAGRDQRLMRAFLDDAPFIHH